MPFHTGPYQKITLGCQTENRIKMMLKKQLREIIACIYECDLSGKIQKIMLLLAPVQYHLTNHRYAQYQQTA